MLEDRKTITLGDINLNSLSWDKNPSQRTLQENRNNQMYEKLLDKIISKGTYKLNFEVTRPTDKTNSQPSCLDHMYTNRAYKIINVKTVQNTFSDHSLQMLVRKTNQFSVQRNYIKTRNFKNYSRETFRENIRNHHLFIQTLYLENTDESQKTLHK